MVALGDKVSYAGDAVANVFGYLFFWIILLIFVFIIFKGGCVKFVADEKCTLSSLAKK